MSMSNLMNKDFPKEIFIPFHHQLDQAPDQIFEGRITLFQLTKSSGQIAFELDILFIETKKIYISVGRQFNFDEEETAIGSAVQMLSNFMKKHAQI